MKVPISKPNTSRQKKTGDWSTKKPSVDKEKCIRCGTCVLYCPEGIIRIIPNDKNVKPKDKDIITDYDYCKGCGICAAVCPVKCIKMVDK
ncbi:MAG: 4Fe-4S binding protein [Candidatus Micrarchaeia archaeon]